MVRFTALLDHQGICETKNDFECEGSLMGNDFGHEL